MVVSNGGSVTDLGVRNGGSLIIGSGGIAISTVISSGGTLTFVGGGIGGWTTLLPGGTLNIGSGTVLDVQHQTSLVATSGASFNVFSGGVLSRADIGDGGFLTVSAGGNALSTVISRGGTLTFMGGGSGAYTTLLPGGTMNIGSGTIYDNQYQTSLVATSGASFNVFSGGVLSRAELGDGGTMTVDTGGNALSTVISRGGTLTFMGGGSGAYTTLLPGGTMNIGSGTIYDNQYQTSLVATSGASFNVFSGGVLSRAELGDGGTMTVDTGGNAFSTVISRGGSLTFMGGGSGAYTTLLPGGTMNIGSGTIYDNQHQTSLVATSGASFNVFSGGVLSRADIGDGGTLTVSAGGVLHDVNVTNGGALSVNSGGTLSGATIDTGGTAIFAAGADETGVTLNGGTISAFNSPPSVIWGSGGGTLVLESGSVDNEERPLAGDARIVVNSGARLSSAVLQSGNSLIVSAGASVAEASVSGGATFSAASGASLTGVVTLQDGGTATIWGTTGGAINLVGDRNNGLTISGMENGGTVGTAIIGWSGSGPGNSDRIALAGVSPAGAIYTYPSNDQVVITLGNGKTVTLTIPGVRSTGFLLVSDGSGGAFAEVCFLAGSMIRTEEGDVPIETLRIGDTITTHDWRTNRPATRPVAWIGKARCQIRPHLPENAAGYPVRVLKDAISDGVPYKDMLITAEHCLFFEGKFIPVRMLVNGRSIFYDTSITAYDYYHVETEDHAVIMADGMLTESYLDTGNRSAFRQERKIVAFPGHAKTWDRDAAAPVAVSRPEVEPLFRRLENRARDAGLAAVAERPELTDDSNLHLVTEGGVVIRPARESNGRAIFLIPSDLGSVRIVSNASCPSDAIGPFVDDRRTLGVLIGEITLFEGASARRLTAHLTNPDLAGWERVESQTMRWTTGSALLPLGPRSCSDIAALAVEIRAAGPYLIQPAREMRRKDVS
ncbi:outer membrane protein [Swaminathania salitolerans LMG 21291]|nr:outer membrane protein [Swaminathania salitolerans LMG 21291]